MATDPQDPLGHAETVASAPRDPSAEAFETTLASDQTTAAGDGAPAFRRVSPDDYTRGPELARGGMGRIVAAHDVRHDRPVALKELLHVTPGSVARFRREALIAARLQHPAIVPIYEAGVWDDDEPFFAMKRVEGESLDRAIGKTEALRDRLAMLPHVIAVADALAYAHARGVIHRDLKPHNVLVGDFGETVVIDWGLAKDLRAPVEPAPPAGDEGPSSPEATGGGLTIAGSALGTPAYMPPEQARGEEVDTRADVYAIGAILYHLLSGIVPYGAAATARALLERVATVPPTPLRDFGLELPDDLVTIVDKAMARDPADRYDDAGALAGDLRRFASGQLVSAHRYSTREMVTRWVRRHRVLVAALLVVLGCAVAGLVVYLRAVGAERAATDRARQVAEQERQRAEDSLAHARAQTVALLEEEGAARLVAGQPLQAAAYLAHAYALGDRSVALRYTLAAAMPAAESVGVAGAGGALTGARFTADGRRFIVAEPKLVRIHAVDTGSEIASLSGDGVPTLALLGDTGTAVVTFGDGSAAVFDTGHGKVVRKLTAERDVSRIAATPDGAVVLFAMLSGLMEAVDPTGKSLWAIRAHPSAIVSLEVSPDGTRIATADIDQQVRVWRTSDGARVDALAGKSPAWGKGAQLGVLDARRGAVIRDVETQREIVLGKASVIALSPRGDRAATASADGPAIELWDAATGARVATLAGHGGGVFALAFDGAGDRLVSSSWDRTARIWDATRGRPMRVLSGQGAPATQLAFAADGAHALTFSASSVRAWPIDPGLAAHTIEAPGARTIAYGPDGAPVIDGPPVAAPAAGKIEVTVTGRAVEFRDARSGQKLAESPGLYTGVALSQDGARAVTIGIETAVWDVERHTRLSSLEGHLGAVNAAAFTPDGELVVTTGDDGTVRVWEAASGRPLDALTGHQGPARAIAMRADGTQAATIGDDGTARLWDLRLEDRAPEAISAIVARDVPWRVDDNGRLVSTD